MLLVQMHHVISVPCFTAKRAPIGFCEIEQANQNPHDKPKARCENADYEMQEVMRPLFFKGARFIA